jgi:hypothetical protein
MFSHGAGLNHEVVNAAEDTVASGGRFWTVASQYSRQAHRLPCKVSEDTTESGGCQGVVGSSPVPICASDRQAVTAPQIGLICKASIRKGLRKCLNPFPGFPRQCSVMMLERTRVSNLFCGRSGDGLPLGHPRHLLVFLDDLLDHSGILERGQITQLGVFADGDLTKDPAHDFA